MISQSKKAMLPYSSSFFVTRVRLPKNSTDATVMTKARTKTSNKFLNLKYNMNMHTAGNGFDGYSIRTVTKTKWGR